jgi:alpha-1,2-mannosyltransferase
VPARRQHSNLLLAAGIVAFAAVLASYVSYAVIHPYNWTLDPVDLKVYWSGGEIVRHATPLYNPHLAAPLYDWAGSGGLKLPFTYTPFAAISFALVSLVPWTLLPKLSIAVNVVLLVAALWCTFGGLGYRRDRVRVGATLLTAAAVFWTEPVLRTMYLGQVNLVLMALIIWDLTQPDTAKSRWWKGAGVGIAAGIKLVPLIFIPYLLITRKFRQAAMAAGTFVATILLGFVILPKDSAKWWFTGLFANGSRTGFPGWEGNQSLEAIITRFVGSVATAKPVWLVAAALTAVLGIVCAAMLARAGHAMVALLLCALTGLLVSPISWDHHWVWIAPGVAVTAHYAVRAWRSAARRWALGLGALTALILATYAAWPESLYSSSRHLGAFSLGLIWYPPNTDPGTYFRDGDRPWFVEYHWHGLELIMGNAFILGGLGLFALLVLIALLTGGGPARVLQAGAPAQEKLGSTV